MAVATYPGTVSPLRGLDAFGESERDVWYGREAERDELAKLVTADGFRAGLLFGEPGAGKTSLVRAGLIPHLRDHGTVALACDDLMSPAASFAAGLASFGLQPTAGELPVMFATRAVANAVVGQQFVFVVDDVDILCADERATAELSDLFARVVSRSGGRARFLFVCASERMNVLGALEKRTGSLFPPSTRYELPRMAPHTAAKVLDRVLAYSGVAADPALAEAVVRGLGGGGPVLPADLQIAGMAMRELRISTAGGLAKIGGAGELESVWLHDACKATGNERQALRLVAELASGGAAARPAELLVRRISLDAGFAEGAFHVLEGRGVIARGDADGATWMLRHELLVPRIKELTAPARAAARQAFDLLGSKTATRGRLSLAELFKLRSEGIAAATPEEASVLERSRRYYIRIAAAIAAVPIALLILIWISMRGHVYFDLAPGPGGDHVVVRGGRPGLHAFFWLPGGFGGEIADLGLTRAMVAPEAWKKIDGHDIGATTAEWPQQVAGITAPELAGLIDYATTGNDAALEVLKKATKDSKDPEDVAELLTALRPIARGSPAEVQLVETALATPSPAVQRAAVATAGSAAQRRSDVFHDTLSKALTSKDSELRRIAFASVRALGDRGRALLSEALAKNPDSGERRELIVELSAQASDDAPSSAGAVAVLGDPDASPPLRERARTQIKAALAKEPDAAASALAALIASDRAPIDARIYAIEVLRDVDPVPKATNVVEAARTAFASKSPAVRAAALPLYAKVDPVRAGGDLANMLDDKKLDKPLRVAAALAWGEVAPSNKEAAAGALDRLLKDDDTDVRAAAAAAAGKAGRVYQDRLVKLAKAEAYPVRIGAAQGLAASAETGGNAGFAVDGIAQLWREKGRPRRDATKIFAHLAKKKPAAVVDYLFQAAHTTEDPALHPIGVEGLCNGALAGSADARARLARSIDDPAIEVRRLVIACVADGPDPVKNGTPIATKLARDPDATIRGDAARVLAMAAAKAGKIPGVAEAIVQLLDDPDRDVRLIAVRAVGGLGAGAAPRTAPQVMARMFEHADEAEKLALVRSARQIGAADLISLAIADSSPVVRVEAVDAALVSGMRVPTTLSAALADFDPTVRKAALERLAAQMDKLEPAALDRALALAVRDPDPELSQLALTTIARVGAKDAVVARLHRALLSRAERERAQAAAAAIGLVGRDPTLAVQLLDPLIDDPSHDVRAAMLPALGAAYARTSDAAKLAGILRDSDNHAMRRLVAAAAFVVLTSAPVTPATGANGQASPAAANAAAGAELGKLAKDGSPMAQQTAKLVIGLAANKADGMAFLQELVP